MRKGKILSTRELVLCALFSALTAVGAYIRIPLPMLTLTLQFFFTNLAALLLGRKLGAFAAAGYVLAGLAGLPIFAGGSGGVAYVLHPTFGYLVGFIAGAWAAGFVAERLRPGMRTWMLAGLTNLAVLYALGMAYYYPIANYYLKTPFGVKALFYYCFLLPLPGDLIKCLLGAVVTDRLRAMLPGGMLPSASAGREVSDKEDIEG